MPTAAKLAASVVFAVLGYFIAQTLVPHLPQGTRLGLFREISAAIGFVVGWLVMGQLPRRSYSEAAGSGVRTAMSLVFWALLGFSIYLMIRKSMHMMYDGPMEAVLGVFDLMLQYAKLMLVPDVIGVVLAGGALGGVVTEWVGRRWK
jgi:hypothetical protein